MGQRQAFIILAHGRLEQLDMLLDALADPDFDIYLHMDAGSNIDDSELQALAEARDNITILPRLNPYWGDFSLVECEIAAFRAVLSRGRAYDHIHLLSGQCLPIRSNEQIKEFFRSHSGREYVLLYDTKNINYPHVRCWIPFPKYLKYKGGSKVKYRLLKIANQICYGLEKIFLMPLWNTRGIDFRMSPQWISITEEAAAFIVGQEEEFRRIYSHSFAPDEFFVGTALWNSHFRSSIVNDSLRYIRWGAKHTPHPFTITSADVPSLLQSGALFARKFDLEREREAVELILKARS